MGKELALEILPNFSNHYVAIFFIHVHIQDLTMFFDRKYNF